MARDKITPRQKNISRLLREKKETTYDKLKAINARFSKKSNFFKAGK